MTPTAQHSEEQLDMLHRAWGYRRPLLDIHCLKLEYYQDEPCALVEYRPEQAMQLRRGHPSIQAIIDLADRADIPAFVVCFATDFSRWHAIPLNERARHFVSEEQCLTERQWVEILYRCRGLTLPSDWAPDLSQETP